MKSLVSKFANQITKLCKFSLVIFIFYPQFSYALVNKQAILYLNAENTINAAPVESTVSVGDIWRKYRALEERWIGAKNVASNHQTIASSPYFAKTNIFNESANTGNESVKYFRLLYTTNYKNKLHNVSGLVLLPPTKTPKGVILFFHSTMNSKLRVPSMKFDEYKTQMLAAIFAANGYVVVAPDYIGLGNDYKSEHPYIIYPRPNVDDGRDMLLASQELLHKNGISFTDNKIPLFVSGYSEGGSYALWFSRIYQQDNQFSQSLTQHGFYLKKTVPIEGAYDVSGVMMPFLLSNQINEKDNQFNINTTLWGSLLKPSLMVNAVLGYADYNNLNAKNLINPNLYSLKCINGLPFCSDINADYSIDSVRLLDANQLKMSLNYYFQAFGLSANDSKYNLFNNSIRSLINPDLLSESSFITDVKQADIINWKSTNPITLISLKQDSLVPEANSTNAYNGMIKAGSTNLKYIQLPNQMLKARTLWGASIVDHVSFELYALLIALNEFNEETR